MTLIFLKALLAWLVLVCIAIANALLRERLMAPSLGPALALPLSGLSLSAFIFLFALATVPLIGKSSSQVYLAIGLFWLLLTLAFEFLFGHYVAGKSWAEIAQVFNLARGDLFILVLITSAIVPWLAAKLRGLI